MYNEKLQKSAPEFSFYHKVKAFFEGDPDIDVGDIDEEEYEFTITVHDKKKCEILKKVLYIPKNAARLTVNIEYECDEKISSVGEKEVAYLLEKNKYFAGYIDGEMDGEDEEALCYRRRHNGLIPGKMRYLLMEPTVVQYYDDIFNNPAGYDTRTAEQLAKELFHGSHCNISSAISSEYV